MLSPSPLNMVCRLYHSTIHGCLCKSSCAQGMLSQCVDPMTHLQVGDCCSPCCAPPGPWHSGASPILYFSWAEHKLTSLLFLLEIVIALVTAFIFAAEFPCWVDPHPSCRSSRLLELFVSPHSMWWTPADQFACFCALMLCSLISSCLLLPGTHFDAGCTGGCSMWIQSKTQHKIKGPNLSFKP